MRGWNVKTGNYIYIDIFLVRRLYGPHLFLIFYNFKGYCFNCNIYTRAAPMGHLYGAIIILL